MKHTLLGLVSLMICLMLVLTGCNLVGVDPIMQLDEDLAAKVKQFSGVVAKYDGGEIKQADVMGNLVSQYNYMSQMYSMYGINMSSDVLTDIEQSVVEAAVEDVAIAKQLESRGLTLAEDKLAEAQESADSAYQQAFDSFRSSAAGENDEVKDKQTEYDLYSNGYTKESFLASAIASANRTLIEDTVKGEITEVTDEELQKAFDDKVAGDQETYEEDHGAFESAMSSESDTVYWIPEGYRTVKHILVKPADDVLQAVTDARKALSDAEKALEDLRTELDDLDDKDADDAEAETADAETEETAEAGEAADSAETEEAPVTLRTAEDIQKDIDEAEAGLEPLKAAAEKAEADCLASVKEKTDEIYGKIEAGEDFAALIEAYGEDPGMKNEPTATRGYYVCADSTTWDQNFTSGAMSLEKVGDVTETPVISTSGVHIIRYESDAQAGAVDFDSVKDALRDETLETMKNDHFDTELKSWVEALNPVYTLDAFKLDD